MPVYRALIGGDAFGEFSYYPSPSIIVDEALDEPNAWMTMLHEVLHCISEMYGLGLKEGQIRTLEVVLWDTFLRNNELRQFCKKI